MNRMSKSRLLAVCAILFGGITIQSEAKCTPSNTESYTSNPAAQQQRQGSVTGTYTPLQGLDMRVTRVVAYGNDLRVYYNVTNNTSDDISIELPQCGTRVRNDEGYDPVMIGGDNTKFSGGPVTLGNDEISNIVGFFRCTIPSGITLNGYAIVKGAAKQSSLKLFTIGGKECSSRNLTKFSYAWSNLNVERISNTNHENVTCSYPSIDINYKNISRQGKDIYLDFTMQLNFEIDAVKLISGMEQGLFNGTKLTLVSSEGDVYKGSLIACDRVICGENVTGINPVSFNDQMPTNIPVKCRIKINNVPTTETSFSLIRFTLVDDKYKVEFRKMPISDK